MNKFVAIFDDGGTLPDVLTGTSSDLIKDVLKLSETAFVIQSPVGTPNLLDDVLIGDDPENYRVVLILKLNGSYSGYQNNDVWDWLDRSRELSAVG